MTTQDLEALRVELYTNPNSRERVTALNKIFMLRTPQSQLIVAHEASNSVQHVLVQAQARRLLAVSKK